MKATTIAPFGGPVDVCWHNGRIVMAWQSGAGTDVRLVVAEIDPVSHVILLSYSIALGDDVGAFPRLLSALGSWWLIYREGASLGGRAVLTRDGREVWRSPVECGGNDPVCLGGVWFAWQQAGTNAVRMSNLTPPYNEVMHRFGAPTGLSRLVGADVILVDEDRGAVPGVTRPSWAGDLVIGEHPDTGALVKAGDGRVLRLFNEQDAYTPRLAHDTQTGAYAAVTWGRQGVRLAVFGDADLSTPAPPPSETWDAPGTAVDCGQFFDVQGSTVPREAEDGQCWQAHRTGDSLYIVKGADPRMVEILRMTPDDVRLAYDATDSRYPRAWRLNDGQK